VPIKTRFDLKTIIIFFKGVTMKKVLIFTLIAVFAISFSLIGVGCAQETAETTAAPETTAAEETTAAPETTAAEETTAAPEEPLKIYYIATDTTTHPFWRAQAESMSEYAEEIGIDLTILDAGDDAEQQTSQVETVVAQGSDAVVYCAADTGVAVSHIAMMKEAGIPVVNNNRQVPEGEYDVQFAFNEVSGGATSATMVVDFLMDKYGEAKGKILELQGALTDENSVLRSEGFYSVTDTYEGVEVITRNTAWDLNKSASEALDAFQANPDIDAIYLQSDYLLPTILNIIEDKPKVGEDGHIYVISLSGDSLSLSLIREGTIDSSLNMDVIQMALISVDFAIDLTEGIIPEAGTTIEEDKPWGPVDVVAAEGGGVKMELREYPVTIDNVDNPDLWGNIYELD
jgi:ABC-type sugar transport system substrate-binding protein